MAANYQDVSPAEQPAFGVCFRDMSVIESNADQHLMLQYLDFKFGLRGEHDREWLSAKQQWINLKSQLPYARAYFYQYRLDNTALTDTVIDDKTYCLLDKVQRCHEVRTEMPQRGDLTE